MPLDPYAACPCGSGKKFKWCCQPIHEELAQAFAQDEQGQHETALKMIDQIAVKHPDNPEVWGRKAQLLFQLERPEHAEEALQKALDLNPNYPYGHYLRGRFRQFEGELPGAVLLFRKAAELYDPAATPVLAEIFMAIADCELKLHHPIAARAALQLAIRYDPASQELRQGLEQIFGEQSRFPSAARRDYKFLGPAANASPERRAAWQRALGEGATGKLSDAARAFERLTEEDANDSAAWYNLALTRAWLGDHPRAVDALDRYVTLEADEQRAAAAWELAEVLRCGHGMENNTDYLEHTYTLPMRDPQRVVQLLGEWEKERRLIGAQVDREQGILTALILQRVTGLTPEHAAAQAPGLGAYVLIHGNSLRLWNTNRAVLDAILTELRERAAGALAEPHHRTGPPQFTEATADALVFPLSATDEETARMRVRQSMENYFEEVWIHRPRVALQGVPPVDAAGHGILRKKLRGVVAFLDECSKLAGYPYDFDRLRRKLGLLEAPAPVAGAPAAAPDLDALGAAELAGLEVASLPDEQLERAYQAAMKLDARALAGRFAKAIVDRPARAERPDRYTWFNHLINLALAEGKSDEAMAYLHAAQKADSEHNEGRRQNDYDLRRGQMHAKRGELDAAQAVLEALIERVPGEMRYRSSAAEAMLSARQGARALRFAEAGLAQARKQNNRDAEQQFLELASSAKKYGG